MAALWRRIRGVEWRVRAGKHLIELPNPVSREVFPQYAGSAPRPAGRDCPLTCRENDYCTNATGDFRLGEPSVQRSRRWPCVVSSIRRALGKS